MKTNKKNITMSLFLGCLTSVCNYGGPSTATTEFGMEELVDKVND